ncbi:hypothetical protein AKJ48_03765 [candidate division MSBL1 archaeon SCGC-AAA261O19]|uniref:HD domain-containing protein n=1 Tax=candidate division MSBL1 archaeon SCGC-AAA261O19 TaxID=1698277 RepID=A0A133VAZ7_9EURY|nr:hypothetical protein AKJ48_03765 [candidate division MSBL1 archaeon SCGC-AAA261O19]
MLTRERALQILSEVGCSPKIIEHTKAVAQESVRIARQISQSGHKVNTSLVEIGAILHDIGRSHTYGIKHGIEGAQILREKGLEDLTGFAENHLGAGISAEEAERIGLPKKDYLPATLEEKIVTYADNLIRGDEIITFEEAVEELKGELGPDHPSLERFSELREKLRDLGGVD